MIVSALVAGMALLASGCASRQPYQPAPTPPPDAARQSCLSQPTAQCLRNQAYEAALGIRNPPLRDQLFMMLAANQILHGELDAGMRSATRIQALPQRYALLARLYSELIGTDGEAADRLERQTRSLNGVHLPYNRTAGEFYLTAMALTGAAHRGELTAAKARQLIDAFIQRHAVSRPRSVAQFAVVLFDQQQAAIAYALVDELKDLYWRSFAMSHFAKAGEHSKRLSRAIDKAVIAAIDRQQPGALQLLSMALAYQQRFDRAARVGHAIAQPYYRAQNIADIAAIAARRDPALARRLIDQASALTEQGNAQRPAANDAGAPPVEVLVAEAMKALAVEQAKRGNIDQALTAAAEIATLSPVVSDACYARLASELALQGQFDTALQIAARIIGAYKRELARANIAVLLHAAGQQQRAFQLAFSLQGRAALDHALGEIALEYARQGDWQRALLLGDKIKLAFKYAYTLNRLSALMAERDHAALATPSNMRIIQPFIRTGSQSKLSYESHHQ
jgi:tetratricopeptide (TPR) repeat protein